MCFWGKLDPASGAFLPLADHCIDFASVFRALCDLPAIRRSLSPLADPIVFDRLAVLALLHDLGKCNTGFQARRDPNARNTAGHVMETAALFYDAELRTKLIAALGLDDMTSWFAD